MAFLKGSFVIFFFLMEVAGSSQEEVFLLLGMKREGKYNKGTVRIRENSFPVSKFLFC